MSPDESSRENRHGATWKRRLEETETEMKRDTLTIDPHFKSSGTRPGSFSQQSSCFGIGGNGRAEKSCITFH